MNKDNEKLTQEELENVSGGSIPGNCNLREIAKRRAKEVAESCKEKGIPYEEAIKAASNDGLCVQVGLSMEEVRTIVMDVYHLI